MSNDFNKVLVQDPRLMPTDSLDYAVYKGPQNNTYQAFNSISLNNSQVSFNAQVPSETTIYNREVLLKTNFTVAVSLDASGGAPGDVENQYGRNWVLAPFPVHQLMTTLQATINNNTTSVNIRDVLPPILRTVDCNELQRWASLTPTQYDQYADYDDSFDNADAPLANSPFNGYGSSVNSDLACRGAFPYDSATYSTDGNSKVLTAVFTSTEPLMVSPFTFLEKYPSNKGMYGVTNMNVVANFGATNRMVRTRFPDLGSADSVSVSVTLNTAELLFNFITAHPSQMMPARNVLPYYDLPRYIDTKSSSIGLSASVNQVQSQNLQLNQIPDYLIIVVEKVEGQKSNGSGTGADAEADPDAWMEINGVSINFNNRSGLLASCSQEDLYKMSVKNGYNGRFEDWVGSAWKVDPSPNVASSLVRTSGSVLILKMGEDVEIGEDFYAPGSIGNFNLQYSVNVTNTLKDALSSYQLKTIVVNSGIYVLERGTSQTYTGLLSKEAVLDASQQRPVSSAEVDRMIGGRSLTGLIKTAIPKLARKVRGALKEADKRAGRAVEDLYGKGVSGGYGLSGGAMHKYM